MTFLVNPFIYGGGALLAVTSYEGDGGLQNIITGQNLAAGSFVWIKETDDTPSHVLQDTERGATKELNSNDTGAESTEPTGITAFGASGFSLGANSRYNGLSDAYIAFSWLEQAGYFDIVTYTGTVGSNAFSHNLNAIPKLIIVKNRSSIINWGVYHVSLGNTKALLLNSDSAAATSGVYWDDTDPTDSEFTVGTAGETNSTGDDYVAYLFAEKAGSSKFGSYTGNGTSQSITGLGFEPKAILSKASTANSDWRLVYNDGSSTKRIFPNASSAASSTTITLDSDGFSVSSEQNDSGQTYIYSAWK